MKKEELVHIIFAVFDNMMEQNDNLKIEKSLDCTLIGEKSNLDSLGLVNFLMMTEQMVSEKLGKEMSIADYELISQQNSPLQNVGLFVDFLHDKISNG